jgi:hypothetical protein
MKPLFACALGLLVAACANTPPIGAGLPHLFADAQPVFDSRIHSRFPVASSEAVLIAELNGERFKITRLDRTNPGKWSV